jgi:hypothetical protein
MIVIKTITGKTSLFIKDHIVLDALAIRLKRPDDKFIQGEAVRFLFPVGPIAEFQSSDETFF